MSNASVPEDSGLQTSPAVNQLDRAGEERLYAAMRHFWHPVMYTADLSDKPESVVLLGEQLVVARLGGEIRCFSDLCVHRGTPLSIGSIEGDQLRCAYHGWTYGPDGGCTSIPSRFGARIPTRARLAAYKVEERYGLVWVCLEDDPVFPLAEFPEASQEDFRIMRAPAYDWETSSHRRIENYVDVSHFAWVHDGVLGDHNRPEVREHEVERHPAEIRYVYQGQEESTDIGKNKGLGAEMESFVSELRYRLFMPGTVLMQQELPGNHGYALFFSTCPIGPKTTRNFTFLARDYDLDDVDAGDRKMLEYNDLVIGQDRPVVTAQRPEELPFDLTAELHIRGVDRVSIEYRQWLVELTNQLVPG
jgi:phenylpropionate dioxygenase-like ring-hydroxylating dioxygenase large terminal subunit